MDAGGCSFHFLGFGPGFGFGPICGEGCGVGGGALCSAGGSIRHFAGDGGGCNGFFPIAAVYGALPRCGAGLKVICPLVSIFGEPGVSDHRDVLRGIVPCFCPGYIEGSCVLGGALVAAAGFYTHTRANGSLGGFLSFTRRANTLCGAVTVVLSPAVGSSAPGVILLRNGLCFGADLVVTDIAVDHFVVAAFLGTGGVFVILLNRFLGSVGDRAGHLTTGIITGGVAGVVPGMDLCCGGLNLADGAEDRAGAVTVVSLGSVGDRTGHLTTGIITGGIAGVGPGVGLCCGCLNLADGTLDSRGAVAVVSFGSVDAFGSIHIAAVGADFPVLFAIGGPGFGIVVLGAVRIAIFLLAFGTNGAGNTGSSAAGAGSFIFNVGAAIDGTLVEVLVVFGSPLVAYAVGTGFVTCPDFCSLFTAGFADLVVLLLLLAVGNGNQVLVILGFKEAVTSSGDRGLCYSLSIAPGTMLTLGQTSFRTGGFLGCINNNIMAQGLRC